jgi:hypothetical protein
MLTRATFAVKLIVLLACLAWADSVAACKPSKGPPSPEQAQTECKPAPPKRPRRAVLQQITPIPSLVAPGPVYGYRPGAPPLPDPALPPRPTPLNCGAAGCVDASGVPYQKPAANVLLDSKGRHCTAQAGWVQCF